jgi:hypothetical protein
VIAWAIVYTRRQGKDLDEPYIFVDTIRNLRKDSWRRFSEGISPDLVRSARRTKGAKAVKVRLEVIA